MTLDLEPDRIALYLDFDGTLVAIAPRPDAVVVPTGLPDLLDRLARRLGGALAVVSGRPVAELDGFLAPSRLPSAGVHGLEWRLSGRDRVEQAIPPAGLAAVRDALAAAPIAEGGVRIEDKGLSIALHYREAPNREPALADLAERLVAAHPDLALLAGKMVFEIKPAGISKASAVRRFQAAHPFAGRMPVVIGDDVTDEDAIRAAVEEGGFGIKVGAGDSLAAHRLAGPSDVLALLARIAER